MPISMLYTCTRCKREFNFGNIKYDSNGKLICVECLGKQQTIENKEKMLVEKAQDDKPINLICVSCRFKFRIKRSSQQAMKCPYCGKTKLMLVKKYKDENDLIHDSMDPRFDY